MRRVSLIVALAALLAVAPASAVKPTRSWAHAEIAFVVANGLMAPDAASFRPDDVLTQPELAELVAGLTGQPTPGTGTSSAAVTLAALNAQLVRALGLQDAAATFARSARLAGLSPPARFGTEVVARLLGLRTNHPAAQERLELLPTDPATRAEAAYSAARILRFTGEELEAVRTAAASFAPPPLDIWQRRVLQTGVRLVGFPYVWGGESERPEGPLAAFGPQAQGGFDCSGLAWRVFKLEPYPEAPSLAETLRGRTTFKLSAEFPPTGRVSLAKLAPGDLAFFGKGPRSKPAQIDHLGIYLGNGWMLHSSHYGVTVAALSGWYRQAFAWGRRPLAEAGLVTESSP
jgi:cell wall-associated NlpC family hydrolase